jgi:hypothetical protein
MVLGLFLNAILENYIEPYRGAGPRPGSSGDHRGGLLVLLAFFG